MGESGDNIFNQLMVCFVCYGVEKLCETRHVRQVPQRLVRGQGGVGESRENKPNGLKHQNNSWFLICVSI